jgi:hypothetical protein
MLSRNAGFDQSANELPMPALNSTLPFVPSWTWCLGSPTGYTRRRRVLFRIGTGVARRQGGVKEYGVDRYPGRQHRLHRARVHLSAQRFVCFYEAASARKYTATSGRAIHVETLRSTLLLPGHFRCHALAPSESVLAGCIYWKSVG